jgi:hypothetical protein
MAARTATAGGTVHPVALAQHPHAVVVDTQTNRAFVTSYGANRRSGVVSVFDTTTGKLVRTVRLNEAESPRQEADARKSRAVVLYLSPRLAWPKHDPSGLNIEFGTDEGEELRVVAHLHIHSHGPPDRSHRPSAAISRSQGTHRKPESCMIGAWHAS